MNRPVPARHVTSPPQSLSVPRTASATNHPIVSIALPSLFPDAHFPMANMRAKSHGAQRRRSALSATARRITRNLILGIVGSQLMIIASLPLEAATVRLRVVDPTGAGVPKILAIVTSLEGKGEIWRGLTDDKGFSSSPDAPAGIYEAIATDPYGPWITKVVDFVLAAAPLVVELRLRTTVVDGVLTTKVEVPVQLLMGDGQPAAGAQVPGRDLEAKHIFWAKTDSQGRAVLTVPLDGAEITVIYEGQVKAQGATIKSGL